MIKKRNGEFIIICDCCGEEHFERYKTFEDVVNDVVSIGWSIVKTSAGIENYCLDCG